MLEVGHSTIAVVAEEVPSCQLHTSKEMLKWFIENVTLRTLIFETLFAKITKRIQEMTPLNIINRKKSEFERIETFLRLSTCLFLNRFVNCNHHHLLRLLSSLFQSQHYHTIISNEGTELTSLLLLLQNPDLRLSNPIQPTKLHRQVSHFVKVVVILTLSLKAAIEEDTAVAFLVVASIEAAVEGGLITFHKMIEEDVAEPWRAAGSQKVVDTLKFDPASIVATTAPKAMECRDVACTSAVAEFLPLRRCLIGKHLEGLTLPSHLNRLFR